MFSCSTFDMVFQNFCSQGLQHVYLHKHEETFAAQVGKWYLPRFLNQFHSTFLKDYSILSRHSWQELKHMGLLGNGFSPFPLCNQFLLFFLLPAVFSSCLLFVIFLYFFVTAFLGH